MDLDDEATRRMNGSDKNVGSIEKDIERCEQLTKPEHANWIGLSNQHSIEHLIKGYKELEEENKIIKGNYYTLSADIQMVTTELGFPEDTIIADELVPKIKENYIEKSLVEEKIEEYKKLTIDPLCNPDVYNWVGILQELLEKRK